MTHGITYKGIRNQRYTKQGIRNQGKLKLWSWHPLDFKPEHEIMAHESHAQSQSKKLQSKSFPFAVFHADSAAQILEY